MSGFGPGASFRRHHTLRKFLAGRRLKSESRGSEEEDEEEAPTNREELRGNHFEVRKRVVCTLIDWRCEEWMPGLSRVFDSCCLFLCELSLSVVLKLSLTLSLNLLSFSTQSLHVFQPLLEILSRYASVSSQICLQCSAVVL